MNDIIVTEYNVIVLGKDKNNQLIVNNYMNNNVSKIPTTGLLSDKLEKENTSGLLINYSISQIACGKEHYMILNHNKDLFVFGDNKYGQLGLGNIEYQNMPQLLMKNVKRIACGKYISFVYTSNGNLYAFGSNMHGQLGDGTLYDSNYNKTPMLLLQDLHIENIACGGTHTMILCKNGDVFVFGDNQLGQLGLGKYSKYETPKLLMHDVDQISCGEFHSMILKKNGELFVFGCNFYGVLGLGKGTADVNSPTLLMRDTEIKQISCGDYHSMILKKNGELFVFGTNSCGQLGMNNNIEIKYTPQLLMRDPDFFSISCKEHHSMILKKNRELFIFGGCDDTQMDTSLECHKNLYNIYSPQLLINNVTLMSNTYDNVWGPKKHFYYSDLFKKKIYYMLLSLKISHLKKYLSKYVLFEIIKKIKNAND